MADADGSYAPKQNEVDEQADETREIAAVAFLLWLALIRDTAKNADDIAALRAVLPDLLEEMDGEDLRTALRKGLTQSRRLGGASGSVDLGRPIEGDVELTDAELDHLVGRLDIGAQLDLIGAVDRKLAAAQAEEKTLAEAWPEIDADLQELFGTNGATAKMIVDTALQTEFTRGRSKALEPALLELPMQVYRAMPGACVSLCAPLNGVTLPVRDTFWLDHSAPMHPSCRCWMERLPRGRVTDPEDLPASVATDGFGSPDSIEDWDPTENRPERFAEVARRKLDRRKLKDSTMALQLAMDDLLTSLRAISFESAPIVDGEWDASAAEARLRKWASSDGSGDKDKIDWKKYGRGFAYVDGDGDRFADFHLPHHDIRDGKFVTVKRGVEAAAGALNGARGAKIAEHMSAKELARVKAHLAEHYHQWDGEAPWEKEDKAKAEAEAVSAGYRAAIISRLQGVSLKFGLSVQDLMNELEVALVARWHERQDARCLPWPYIIDVFPNSEPPTVVFVMDRRQYSLVYSVTDGKVVFDKEAKPVRRTYEPIEGEATIQLKAVLEELPESDLPTEFRIFRRGKNDSLKGVFVFDEDSAVDVMAAYREHKTELQIDYEHASTFDGDDVPEGAPAAAWFVPAIRDSELWATKVRWTEKAAAHLKSREYRYFSPTFASNKGRVTRLISIALTNVPALDNLEPLVAAADKPGQGINMTADEMKQEMKGMLTDFLKSDEMGKHMAKHMTTAMKEHLPEALKEHMKEHAGKIEEACMKACKGMLEEHSKKMSDRMDEMDKKTKASDDAEATKLTSKAQGLIDAHRGGKITPAEAKDLEKKLSDKTVTPEYVESFVTAKAGIQAGGNGGGQAAPPALDFGFTEEIVINLRANPETKHLKSATAQVMNDLAGEIVINARNYSERIAHNGQVFHLKAKTPEAVAASWRGNVTRYQANEKRKKTIVPPRYIDESQPFLVL